MRKLIALVRVPGGHSTWVRLPVPGGHSTW